MMLFWQNGCDGFGHVLQCSRMTLDHVHIIGLQSRLHLCYCFGSLELIINDLLCYAFEIDQHLQDILRDDRESPCDGEESIENLVCNACIFHHESMKRAN